MIGQTTYDRIRVFQCAQWSAMPCVVWLEQAREKTDQEITITLLCQWRTGEGLRYARQNQ
ncbi:hypothetical protein [Xenorhabdus beddingii]|uniref:hypothetical protein n=1 Tax=Xenorhabdus beddingii TaxID=40578 RepID=UPI001428984D|nr:hypothetical protein [Xenorhabdus beddingii]